MGVLQSTRYRVLIVLLVSLATISFHYGLIIKPSHEASGVFHAIHGRLCYIPIILGAIWFGIRGGLATAIFIVALTLPYGFMGAGGHGSSLASELTEMVFYLAIGLLAGILIEQQRRERRRREALAVELARQQHLSSLGTMAAGLAHEIKNPLGSIKGSAEILGDDFPEGSKKHEILQVLRKETTRLNGVVEDFLQFARPRPLKRGPTQVNALLGEVIAQIKVDSGAQAVQIEKHLDDTIPVALLDAEKLHQVFLNISLNAVAAMPSGGRLLIETQLRAHGRDRQIVVHFRDEGKGIRPDDLDKIFDPFFTTGEKGTGLGLSISHMIVQNHGGHLSVADNAGRGATFTITLPVVEER